METIEAKIDRLLHDAEHAESGAEFARMMMRTNPTNPVHADAARNLEAKAKAIRAEVVLLQAAR